MPYIRKLWAKNTLKPHIKTQFTMSSPKKVDGRRHNELHKSLIWTGANNKVGMLHQKVAKARPMKRAKNPRLQECPKR